MAGGHGLGRGSVGYHHCCLVFVVAVVVCRCRSRLVMTTVALSDEDVLVVVRDGGVVGSVAQLAYVLQVASDVAEVLFGLGAVL